MELIENLLQLLVTFIGALLSGISYRKSGRQAYFLLLCFLCESIMFPTIFSLGIHGLGARAKKASSFIVMAIMGGAIMPKLMGHVADMHGMSAGFVVPMVCFVVVACYGCFWSKLSGTTGVVGMSAAKGH